MKGLPAGFGLGPCYSRYKHRNTLWRQGSEPLHRDGTVKMKHGFWILFHFLTGYEDEMNTLVAAGRGL